MNKIDFAHTIHEKRGHVQGAFPPEDAEKHNQIHQLAKAADAALYQQRGYFFDTLDTEVPIFAFGFLHIEKENRSEPFFDIYLTKIEHIRGASLVDIKNQLAQNTKNISNRHDPISQILTIEVSRTVDHTAKNSEPTSQQQTQENFEERRKKASTSSQEPRNTAAMSIEEIAEIWEHYRRTEVKVPATISEINRFVSSVSNSIGKINYVSRVAERGDPSRFEFIGGTSRKDIDTSSLVSWLNNQNNVAQLKWDDLPTYREELEQLRSEVSEDIRTSGNYDEISTKIGNWLVDVIQSELAECHHQRAVEIFNKSIDESFSEPKDTGKLNQLRNLVSSERSNDQYDAIAAGIQTQTIDENTKAKIAKELGKETRMELTERLETKIIEDLNQNLEDLIAEEVENILEQTIQQIDKVKTSRPYKESTSNQ